MKNLILIILFGFLSFNDVSIGERKPLLKLSNDQYKIVNSLLGTDSTVRLSMHTSFLYHWGNYLNTDWLSKDPGFCISQKNGFEKREISDHIDNRTLSAMREKISNISGSFLLEKNKIHSKDVKLVKDFTSNNLLYLSPPVIEGKHAVIYYKLLWNEKIIFFKQNVNGDWSTFCEFYLVESTRNDGIS
ncbi:hypothetical protein [Mongoliibacter ruber]|uniref:Uncharacterized protein n=1 Tax=Mongoliibacter ruber TaxID=1750599 RepID=A0A2T0WMW1_9BACT|nr:hypothetical protein [Mongoliibacter ruber]PRY88048.1 hypothetical protein CLW00_105169 [Mongoliibacter ruber]